MKHNSIKLRREVFKSDAWKMIDWLHDNMVTQYLNEYNNVCNSIKDVMRRVNMPILTHLFNQDGAFFYDNNKYKGRRAYRIFKIST